MKQIFILLLLGFTLNVFGQNIDVKAKFIIQDARVNDVDVTEEILAVDARLIVYMDKDDPDNLKFANMHKTSGSFGRIFNVNTEQSPETAENYGFKAYTFRWSYENSYDRKKGTANVRLVKIFKPTGVAFECTIIPENLDKLSYKGYMEGSLAGFD